MVLGQKGWTVQKSSADSYIWKEMDMKETLARMSQYSMYALEEEIRGGFFTIQGGHRIGVVGKTVCEQGKVTAIRNICGLNVRVARQKRLCQRSASMADEGRKFLQYVDTFTTRSWQNHHAPRLYPSAVKGNACNAREKGGSSGRAQRVSSQFFRGSPK